MAKKLDTKTDWSGYYQGTVYRITATNRFDVHTETIPFWTVIRQVGEAAWERIVYNDDGSYSSTNIGLSFIYENRDKFLETVGINNNSFRENLVLKTKGRKVLKYQNTTRQSSADNSLAPENKVNYVIFKRVKTLPANILL